MCLASLETMPTRARPFVDCGDYADEGGALRWSLRLCRRGLGPSLFLETMPARGRALSLVFEAKPTRDGALRWSLFSD